MKRPVVFCNPENNKVCKVKFMTLTEIVNVHPKYQVYMLGTTFMVPQDYNKLNIPERKPTGFTEETGVFQTILMYESFSKILNYEIESRR